MLKCALLYIPESPKCEEHLCISTETSRYQNLIIVRFSTSPHAAVAEIKYNIITISISFLTILHHLGLDQPSKFVIVPLDAHDESWLSSSRICFLENPPIRGDARTFSADPSIRHYCRVMCRLTGW